MFSRLRYSKTITFPRRKTPILDGLGLRCEANSIKTPMDSSTAMMAGLDWATFEISFGPRYVPKFLWWIIPSMSLIASIVYIKIRETSVVTQTCIPNIECTLTLIIYIYIYVHTQQSCDMIPLYPHDTALFLSWSPFCLVIVGIPMICIWESSHLASVPFIAGEPGSFGEMFAAYLEVHPT